MLVRQFEARLGLVVWESRRRRILLEGLERDDRAAPKGNNFANLARPFGSEEECTLQKLMTTSLYLIV
jgi:hypothetical protein